MDVCVWVCGLVKGKKLSGQLEDSKEYQDSRDIHNGRLLPPVVDK